MYRLPVFVFISFIGCSSNYSNTTLKSEIPEQAIEDASICEDGLQGEDDFREDVLIIGDSISMGYLPHVQSKLPEYDVMRCPCNGRSSRNGVLNIESWLSKRTNWTAIVFNHGLWDAVIEFNISLSDYEANLRVIAERLKQTGAVVIFNTTTYIPIGETGRIFGHELVMNDVARRVMSDLNIPVNDLYAVSRTIPHLMKNYPNDNDVHYTDEGSQVLAESLVLKIKEQLN